MSDKKNLTNSYFYSGTRRTSLMGHMNSINRTISDPTRKSYLTLLLRPPFSSKRFRLRLHRTD